MLYDFVVFFYLLLVDASHAQVLSAVPQLRLALHCPMPMTPPVARVSAVALEALRAATLAAHHAAGLCRSAKLFNAARSARTGEAMLRSGIALAMAGASSGPPVAHHSGPRQPNVRETEPPPAEGARETEHKSSGDRTVHFLQGDEEARQEEEQGQ